jgi:hypothetical protein
MSAEREPTRHVAPESVRVAREGHGANCSSIGSVVDTLFAAAAVGTAVFAALAAALATEDVQVVRHPPARPYSPQADGASPPDGAERDRP